MMSDRRTALGAASHLIALNFADTTTLDHRLAGQLHCDPHYRTMAVVPYGTEIPPTGQGTYVIWRYEPQP
jgi:hypothetical protein